MQEAWKLSNRMILDSMIDKGISIKKVFNPCYIARTTACYIDERCKKDTTIKEERNELQTKDNIWCLKLKFNIAHLIANLLQ